MKENFLLSSKAAIELYNSVKDLPIIDYHNHLSIDDIKQNRRFLDIYDLWIKPDPYKHRAMRMCGVAEKYITGDGSSKDKFIKWCEVFPSLLGNPLYHWSIMELDRVFGISEIPNAKNAEQIYRQCNDFLQNNVITANSLLDQFNVALACPCASLVEDIDVFEENPRICPSLRGDDIVAADQAFKEKLCRITGTDNFEKGVQLRLDRFEACGLVFADHALDNGFQFQKDSMLVFLGKEYAKRGLVMQLHLGAERYTSTKLRKAAGPAGGFAAIGNSVDVRSLTAFLDALDMSQYGLPKTVLFPLNPADNALISVLSGSYAKDGVRGLITQGPAWWWCDHKQGILDMLANTASFSVLSNFIGMTTDSRSFLSFVRHDYFRRLLCDFVSREFEADTEGLKELVYRLCYGNAKEILTGRKEP